MTMEQLLWRSVSLQLSPEVNSQLQLIEKGCMKWPRNLDSLASDFLYLGLTNWCVHVWCVTVP